MMDKSTIQQLNLDIARLENAADRLRDLAAAYKETRNDLEITKSALKVIATRAKCAKHGDTENLLRSLHVKAMDTLAVISEANR